MSRATQPVRVVLFDVGGVLVELSGVATVMGWVADHLGLRASFAVLLLSTVGVAVSGLLTPAPERVKNARV